MKAVATLAFCFWMGFFAFALADDAETDLGSQLRPAASSSQLKENIYGSPNITIFGFGLFPKASINDLIEALSADENNISLLKSAYDNLKSENSSLSNRIQSMNQTPENCILEEMKNARSDGGAAQMIRFSCIRRYILANLPSAIDVAGASSMHDTLRYNPGLQIPPNPETVTVSVENVSAFQIIAADIVIINKSNKADSRQYRIYVDYPIDPSAAGTLSGETLLNLPDAESFSREYNWYFVHLWAVPVPQ